MTPQNRKLISRRPRNTIINTQWGAGQFHGRLTFPLCDLWLPFLGAGEQWGECLFNRLRYSGCNTSMGARNFTPFSLSDINLKCQQVVKQKCHAPPIINHTGVKTLPEGRNFQRAPRRWMQNVASGDDFFMNVVFLHCSCQPGKRGEKLLCVKVHSPLLVKVHTHTQIKGWVAWVEKTKECQVEYHYIINS